MGYTGTYAAQEPAYRDVEAGQGWQLLEFGAPWCPHCVAAQVPVQQWAEAHDVPHLKIEDGKGRPLGRAFQVKLWPTLILLRDGQEQARVVRPRSVQDLAPLALPPA